MPTSSWNASCRENARRWWPEAIIALLALIIFTGALGSIEIWGKREQRASLEALDTLDNHHWLVAHVQGHPRLEKPPLSRWSIAAVMALTGRRDEWVVRLPSALSGILIVGLVYGLGCRIHGRSVGRASALILCATPFFITEMRQAGNDSLLALFTTLSLYSAWRRLEEGDARWVRLFSMALGFGVLSKGPVILQVVGTTLIPYLIIVGRLRPGLRKLVDPWGLALFLALALIWPSLVMLKDPNAAGVWALEMGQKTGLSHLVEHRHHSLLAIDWPGMVLPWPLIGFLGVALPLILARRRGDASAGSSNVWFAWCWAIANLAVFCLWRVAKPSYYLPCLPGAAILLGFAWVWIGREARLPSRFGLSARLTLQVQWVLLFAGSLCAPVICRSFVVPTVWPWTIPLAAGVAGAVIASAFLWRKGSEALSLLPFASASALAAGIGYGIMAPTENRDRGLGDLARTLDQLAPAKAQVRFLQEIDEGLSFYLHNHALVPVPGTERRYNASYDYVDDYLNKRRELVTREVVEEQAPESLKQSLISWLNQPGTNSEANYLLVPSRFYDRFEKVLSTRMVPVLREEKKKRNELTLLKIVDKPASAIATAPELPENARR